MPTTGARPPSSLSRTFARLPARPQEYSAGRTGFQEKQREGREAVERPGDTQNDQLQQ